MRSRAGSLLALLTLLALVLSGCSFFGEDGPEPLDADPLPTGDPTAGVPAPLQRYYAQTLDWRECRGSMECADLEVPLDYDRPEGETVTLSVLKRPAEDSDRRIGSLVVNPGGPGVSAVDYAATAPTYFRQRLLDTFDVVGFDPRGVGESTAVDCLDDAGLDTYVSSDPDPDTPAEFREARSEFRAFGEGCLDRSGDLARHISTEETARDLDVVRAVLGQERLTYFGASYGTFIGATYADLFPDRVGRLVLDGALDPSTGPVEGALVQAEGFETALRSYVQACVDDGDCYLGDSVDAGTERVRALLDQLDEQPLDVDGTELTEGLAVYGIFAPLYDKDYWGLLDKALEGAFEGDGETLLALGRAYTSRGPEGYTNNSIEALVSINCLDRPEGVSRARQKALEPRFAEAAPTFGSIFATGLTGCKEWPIQTGNRPERLTAKGAAPILVVGTTRDPATPLRWAEALADQLDSGVLVRRDGDGHTGYNAGNECVDDAVERYLVQGVVPDGTLDC